LTYFSSITFLFLIFFSISWFWYSTFYLFDLLVEIFYFLRVVSWSKQPRHVPYLEEGLPIISADNSCRFVLKMVHIFFLKGSLNTLLSDNVLISPIISSIIFSCRTSAVALLSLATALADATFSASSSHDLTMESGASSSTGFQTGSPVCT